jgi:hypothetical protein
MDLSGFEVEAQLPSAADLATDAGRWFADVFGVVPRLATYVEDLDAALTELAAKGVGVAPVEAPADDDAGEVRAVRLQGPAGLTIDVVQPVPAGHHESRITELIESATDLEGPPTEDVADAIEQIVADAWEAIGARLEGVANNKVLATQLLVGQRSRAAAPDEPLFWQRSAASSLRSWYVGRGASG